jgi:Tetrapyrrole (Corrin/Porphyrin) Methylases
VRTKKGSLVVVGTGLRLAGQITVESLAYVRSARKLLCLADPITESWLRQENPTCESLRGYYAPGKPRLKTYREMADHILRAVDDESPVCAAFYGHPGVLVNAGHDAIRRARRRGHEARMLPGVSALDCLIADLGMDLTLSGFQTFEATGFLTRRRKYDPSCALILWQPGIVGVSGYYRQPQNWNVAGFKILAETLAKIYGPKHKVIVYEASMFPTCKPVMQRASLERLGELEITISSLIYVPPSRPAPWNRKMIARLKWP